MIRKPEELTLAIKSAVNRKAVVFSHVLVAVTGLLQTILWPNTLWYEIYLALFLSTALIIMLFLRVFDFASINKHPFIYLCFYQVLLFFGIAFMTEPATPYILIALVPAYIGNIYYGKKGVHLTVVVVGLATITKYFAWYFEGPLTREGTLDIFAAFFIYWAVSSFFINIQAVFDWDRSRAKDLLRQSQLEQEKLSVLINSMTESVLVLDSSGDIRLHNEAAKDLLNRSSLLGLNISAVADFEDNKELPLAFSDLIPAEGETTMRDDIILRYSEKDHAVLSITVSPLKTSLTDTTDGYTGFVFTMHDVSKQKSLEDERNEFVSVISHELRTPLTVTEGGLSNAMMINEKNGNNPELQKTLEITHKQVVMLEGVLNDLATFAEAENNSLEFIKTETKLANILERIEREFSKEAEAKGLKFKATLSKNLPESILSNHNYVYEIVSNLVSNAIKYSEKGTVRLDVENSPDGQIKFVVTDNGLGIALTEQKRVFDKFYRSEDFRTRASGGTGLGLYISQKLAHIIQGKITLKSELGSGSTFTLTLPMFTQNDVTHAKEIIDNLNTNDNQTQKVKLQSAIQTD